MHSTKGLLWLAHTESAMRAERARALMNQACGAETVMITPEEAKELCPQLDLTGGGRYPVLGASYHPGAPTARHDRVVWAYAAGRDAARRPRHPAHAGDGAAARRAPRGGRRRRPTDRSPRASSCARSAAGSRPWPRMADLRLPIRTHPLQALVTNAYAQGFGPIVASSELLCYVSQTAAARC